LEIFLKKPGLIFLTAVLLSVGVGCVSSRASVLAVDRSPIALVSMVSNMYAFWHGEEPIGPDPIGFVVPRALRADPDNVIAASMDELINTAEMMFRGAMARSPLINLAEREEVLFSRAYQNARVQWHRVYDDITMPAGYKFVDIRDRDFFSALARETGLQRSMFVEFEFTKAIIGGFVFGQTGDLRAELTMRVIVLDAQGRTIFRNSYSTWSDSTISVTGGVYPQSGLIDLFEFILDDVYNEFLHHLSN